MQGTAINDPANWEDFDDSESRSLKFTSKPLKRIDFKESDLDGEKLIGSTSFICSRDLAYKLIKLIPGKSVSDSSAKPIKFRSVGDLYKSLSQRRLQGHMKKLLGLAQYNELMELFEVKMEVMRI